MPTDIPTDPSEQSMAARTASCPNCSSALEIELAATRSIVCGRCRAVVDVGDGAGAGFFLQEHRGAAPALPLGAVGQLALGPLRPTQQWRVCGYVERCEAGDEDESWREYLLHNRSEGFAFLVDDDGDWNWVAPIRDTPEVQGGRAEFQGVAYRQRYRYTATTTFALGEFYWALKRDQREHCVDYAGTGRDSNKRLDREEADGEVTWSAGETIGAAEVEASFRSSLPPGVALRPAAAAAGGSVIVKLLIALAAAVGLMQGLSYCSQRDCEPLRTAFGEASNEYQQCISEAGAVRSGRRWFGGGSRRHK